MLSDGEIMLSARDHRNGHGESSEWVLLETVVSSGST